MTALFNFAEEDRTAWIEEEGEYKQRNAKVR